MFGLTPEMLLGKGTIHVPLNLIVQRADDRGRVTGVFQSSMGEPLLFGSKATNQLVLGDAFFRPHLVCETDEFRGAGIGHLAKIGFIDLDKWTPGLIYARDPEMREAFKKGQRHGNGS